MTRMRKPRQPPQLRRLHQKAAHRYSCRLVTAADTICRKRVQALVQASGRRPTFSYGETAFADPGPSVALPCLPVACTRCASGRSSSGGAGNASSAPATSSRRGTVYIHRQLDRGMPQHRLYAPRRQAALAQVRSERVPRSAGPGESLPGTGNSAWAWAHPWGGLRLRQQQFDDLPLPVRDQTQAPGQGDSFRQPGLPYLAGARLRKILLLLELQSRLWTGPVAAC